MSYSDKVAYLKGLIDGMDLDQNSKEFKLFGAVFGALEEMALALGRLEDVSDALESELEDLSEGLADVEDAVYGDEDADEEDEDDEDDETYMLRCTACGEDIVLDPEALGEGKIKCPACGQEIELACMCGDDECGCGDDECGCGDGECGCCGDADECEDGCCCADGDCGCGEDEE